MSEQDETPPAQPADQLGGQQEAVHGQQHMPRIEPGARVAGVDDKTPKVAPAAAPRASGGAARDARHKWDKAKGMAKKTWSQLTEADFVKADGSIDKLYDVIHEKAGESRASVKTKLDQLLA